MLRRAIAMVRAPTRGSQPVKGLTEPRTPSAVAGSMRSQKSTGRVVQIRHDPSYDAAYAAKDTRSGLVVLRHQDSGRLREMCDRLGWQVVEDGSDRRVRVRDGAPARYWTLVTPNTSRANPGNPIATTTSEKANAPIMIVSPGACRKVPAHLTGRTCRHSAWGMCWPSQNGRLAGQRFANCARHRGVRRDIFEARHAAMRSLSGIAELHSMIASPMQAARCSGVPWVSANAAVGSTLRSKPAAPSTPLRILIMAVSHRAHTPPLTWKWVVMPPRPREKCDGHHIFSLLRRSLMRPLGPPAGHALVANIRLSDGRSGEI